MSRSPDMRVAKRHRDVAMTEQPCDDRDRNALQHGLAREGVTQVVEPHVPESGLATHAVPQAEALRARSCGSTRRRKDVGTRGAGLLRQDALRRGIEVDRLGSGLAVAELEGVAVDFVPAQMDDLTPSAAREQEEADDVGLGCTGPPFGDASVEMLVQDPDLVP